MANNRLYLVHRPTNASVYLGKRMAHGWYGAYPELGEKMAEFFEAAGDYLDQDDFVLALEDASGAPGATDRWKYVGPDNEIELDNPLPDGEPEYRSWLND